MEKQVGLVLEVLMELVALLVVVAEEVPGSLEAMGRKAQPFCVKEFVVVLVDQVV